MSKKGDRNLAKLRRRIEETGITADEDGNYLFEVPISDSYTRQYRLRFNDSGTMCWESKNLLTGEWSLINSYIVGPLARDMSILDYILSKYSATSD